MKNQKGFTLIELMIVVAIIAILAAIAIPQYNDFTARAQMSEAYTLAAGLKTPIAEAYSQDNGDGSCAKPANAVSTGKYVDTVAVAKSGNNCAVTATMKTSGVNAKASGKNVVLTFTPGTGAWSCATSAASEVQPKACVTVAANPQ
ncbi:pilin [Stenotrophomonas sp.]|uniref:pilin n=1 Tax=Stenotrophomonas sp. TaxID=69392 RepID=UPI0028ABA071|nr:pilin [Stenotrophomonas sp.]